MSFKIYSRDPLYIQRLKLIYLLPISLVVMPFLVLYVGFIEVVPGNIRHLYRVVRYGHA